MLKAYRKLFTRIFAVLLAVLFLCMPSYHARAVSLMDTEREVKLTVTFLIYGSPVEGMEFRAFRIGTLNSYGEVAFTEPFSDYPVGVPRESSEFRELAETLEGYILNDDISPDYIGNTNQYGRLEYGVVEQGVYLILSDPYTVGTKTFFADPFIVMAPTVGQSGENWVYDVEVFPKHSIVDSISEEPTTEVTVLKVWQGVKDGETHPESVTVRLLCNGEPWKEDIVLNRDNNWRHTWKELPISAKFDVIEVTPPEGYKVSVLHNANLYTITNTYVPPEESTPPPESSTPPPPQTPPPKIPQTGQDWLMVIGLFAGGFLLMAVGYVRKRTA